jgi:drug/metabolite transporter (DMT)-like permease
MRKALGERTGMRRKWLPIGGLLLLSLLWAVGWVRADLSPGSGAALRLSPLWSQTGLLGIFAGLAGMAAIARNRRWPERRAAGTAVFIGIGMFVLPTVVVTLAAEWIDDATRAALFSVTPVFAVVFEPYLGAGVNQARGSFPAAMMAVAGTLLVFPVDLPNSDTSAFAFVGVVIAAVSVAAANCVAVRELKGGNRSALWFAAVASGSAACLIAMIMLLFRERAASSVRVGIWTLADLLAMALLFWLMPRMSAIQMTTRFVIAPLMANLVSLAVLRPHVQLQSWIGLFLIALGSGWLLVGPSDTQRSKVVP